jgi:hypothetical protein
MDRDLATLLSGASDFIERSQGIERPFTEWLRVQRNAKQRAHGLAVFSPI